MESVFENSAALPAKASMLLGLIQRREPPDVANYLAVMKPRRPSSSHTECKQAHVANASAP
jgi:hypothetical protein